MSDKIIRNDIADYTGSSAVAVSNSFIIASEQAGFDLNIRKLNILLYAVNNYCFKTYGSVLFYNEFIMLDIFGKLTPCIIDIIALYGYEKPVLIHNINNTAVIADYNTETIAGRCIMYILKKYRHLTADEIIDDVKSSDIALKNAKINTLLRW